MSVRFAVNVWINGIVPQSGELGSANQPTNRRRRRILVIGAVIGVLGLFFGIRYWMYASTHEGTDDAYVTGYTHQISSRITGTVEEVLVDDNWHVTAGQPLIKLDPCDYEVALKQARASYLQAQAQLLQARAQIPLAEAQLAQAQAQADSSKANCDYLQRTFERDSQLFYQGRGVISRQDLDTAQSQAETSSLIAFLEEGQNDDWFTSVFIQGAFTLAVIFIPLFIICELVSKTPVVNLRLLRIRNLGLAAAVNMNPDFGGPQFQVGNIIRALGQPFTIVPLSAVATAGLLREQQPDGSALFNIMRNLGGSVATALLSTMITQREQFHDFRIGERVTPYNPYVQQFLSNQSVQNLQHSGDPVGALQQAYRMLQAAVPRLIQDEGLRRFADCQQASSR